MSRPRIWKSIPLNMNYLDGSYNRPVYRIVHDCGNIKWFTEYPSSTDLIWCERCGQNFERPAVVYRAVVRWVDTAAWYKPCTWCTGYWEEKEERKAEA